MNILTKATVQVLNRNWQAINVRTPQEAFCMMATNVATGLEIEGEDHIRPVTWEEWITLPIREQDEAVRTVRGQIRVPTGPRRSRGTRKRDSVVCGLWLGTSVYRGPPTSMVRL